MSGAARQPALPGKALTKRDLAWLEKSWIDADLARRARLRRVDRSEAAEFVGRDSARCDCAGILFPYYWPGDGHVRDHRIRRDAPDIEIKADGTRKERAKYLSPPGRGSMFYFSPDVEPSMLDDTRLPVVLVEGEKKTLALQRLAAHENVGARFLAIGIAGVWNWRRTTKEPAADGGTRDVKEPIADFDRVAWPGRTVYVCFDADVRTNKEVLRARWALAKELARGRKALVHYLELPAGEHKGVDDLLAGEGPQAVLALFERAPHADILHDVRRIIESAQEQNDPLVVLQPEAVSLFAQLGELQRMDACMRLKAAFPGAFRPSEFERAVKDERRRRSLEIESQRTRRPEYAGLEYVETENGIWRFRKSDGGHIAQQLTNFTARIIATIRRDDGETTEQAVRVQARMHDMESSFIVTHDEFHEMRWPMREIHFSAWITPGCEPAARVAIQHLSHGASVKTVRTHTGWTIQEGRPVYLHAGGAITENGLAREMEVDYDGKMRGFTLPDPEESRAAVQQAVDASLRLLDVAPPKITFPLYAAIWRVPLGPVNTTVFLSGQTQVGKTHLAALAQQHFGAGLTAENLPAGWFDSANALEAKLFLLKDALVVIDDFNPQGSDGDIQRMHALADRVIRSQGNKTGRGRLTSDIRLRAPRWPRGMIISTGEDTPRGHSLRARMRPLGECIGWVDRDEVYLEPGASFAVAKRVATAMGENIPVSAKTLNKRLRDRGMLTAGGQPEITVKRMVAGARRRVLALSAELLSPLGKSGQSGRAPGFDPGDLDNPGRNPGATRESPSRRAHADPS
jgi:hypothetical protein